VSTPELLRDMIEAVLNPPTPIESVEILNPEIPKDFPNDKGIALRRGPNPRGTRSARE